MINIGDKIKIGDNYYLCVAKSDEIKEGKGKQIKLGEEYEKQVAILRHCNKLYCLSNICPHRHLDSIYKGILIDGKVICPEHGWAYDLTTGLNVDSRKGIKSLKVYEVVEIEGLVFIPEIRFELPRWKHYGVPR